MRNFLIIILTFLAGCQSNNFNTVDFKYSNLAHMNVDDAMVELDADPKSLIFALGESFVAQENLILERKQLDFFYEKNKDYKSCWNASNEIFKAEFLAYQQNNFSLYKKLDREEIFKNNGVTSKWYLFKYNKKVTQ